MVGIAMTKNDFFYRNYNERNNYLRQSNLKVFKH